MVHLISLKTPPFLVVGALTNEVAAALMAVMTPCERRARPSCRGKKKLETVGNTEDDSPQPEQPKPICSMDDDVEIIGRDSPNQKGWIIFVLFLVPTFPSFPGSPALRGGTDFAKDIEGHLEQCEASRC